MNRTMSVIIPVAKIITFISLLTTNSSLALGGSLIISGSAGSTVSAKYGKPSEIKFIYKICVAKIGKGKPKSIAKDMRIISPKQSVRR